MASDEPNERSPFAFAGMWRGSFYETKDGPESCLTHTIITTSANELVKPVHPQRMPVILDSADFKEWLHGDAEEAQRLLRPFPEERMRVVREGVGVKADPIG